MKDLASYPITFSFGVTTDPYTPSHPHRGNDRAAPLGTPIIVQGTTIGFVGMTGFATGPHCHTQEWHTNKLNVRRPQNEFKPGTVTEVDVNGTTGDGSLGKYVTVRNIDGWSTSYCHMNVVNIKVGQDITQQGGTMDKDNRIKALEASEQRLANEVHIRDVRITQLESRIKALEASEQFLAEEVTKRDKIITDFDSNADNAVTILEPGDYRVVKEF